MQQRESNLADQWEQLERAKAFLLEDRANLEQTRHSLKQSTLHSPHTAAADVIPISSEVGEPSGYLQQVRRDLRAEIAGDDQTIREFNQVPEDQLPDDTFELDDARARRKEACGLLNLIDSTILPREKEVVEMEQKALAHLDQVRDAEKRQEELEQRQKQLLGQKEKLENAIIDAKQRRKLFDDKNTDIATRRAGLEEQTTLLDQEKASAEARKHGLQERKLALDGRRAALLEKARMRKAAEDAARAEYEKRLKALNDLGPQPDTDLEVFEQDLEDQEKSIYEQKEALSSQKVTADAKFKENQDTLNLNLADLKATPQATRLERRDETGESKNSVLAASIAEKKGEIERLRSDLRPDAEMQRQAAEVSLALSTLLTEEGEHNKRVAEIQFEEDIVRAQEEALSAELADLESEKQSQQFAEMQANKFIQVYENQLKKGEAERLLIVEKIDRLRSSRAEN
jgi:hypothetical protein